MISTSARPHLALNLTNLYSLLSTRTHIVLTSRRTPPSSTAPWPSWLLRMFKTSSSCKHYVGIPASTNSCLSPPPCVRFVHFLSTSTQGILSRGNPPLLLLHGSYKLYLCKQNSKSLQHVTSGRESAILLNEQHSNTEQNALNKSTDFCSPLGSSLHSSL